jgi:hypothetical protein
LSARVLAYPTKVNKMKQLQMFIVRIFDFNPNETQSPAALI